MATPQTGSPFNRRIATDINYIASGSIASAGTALDFIQAVPYPTTTERCLLAAKLILNTATSSGASASLFLQHSADNSTFTNITQKATPFFKILNTGAGVTTAEITTSFEPDMQRYLRASCSLSNLADTNSYQTVTGSYNLTVLF